MKGKWLLLNFICLMIAMQLQAQKAIIKGQIRDAQTLEPMPGVNIIAGKTTGSVSDINGKYILHVPEGKYRISYSLIGYQKMVMTVDVKSGEEKVVDVSLEPRVEWLQETVVTASRYEQKLSDVIVSMEVLNAGRIENTHTLSLEEAVEQVPGVTLLDDQASIRGGNGYSYGVGSRVMLMVDELPFLTGAGSEAKWNFLPIENISSVEVIKGASSALFGSSALNGVINIRTAYPKEKPETALTIYSGVYGNPARPEVKWWGDHNPVYTGLRLHHSRRIQRLDLSTGITMHSDQGYREKETEQFARFSLSTRYRMKNPDGLSFGVNGSYMRSKGGNFLIWLNGNDGIYRPTPSFDPRFDNERIHIDPFITYVVSPTQKHSIKTRFFKTSYKNDTLTQTIDETYYAEYQYFKSFSDNLNFVAGASSQYVRAQSSFYGNQLHTSSNRALFMQIEQRIQRFRLTLGARYELYRINKVTDDSRPLFRAGLNYKVGEYTFLRATMGQGYRFPAIAEKYAATKVGALQIFPNPELKAEKGWNAELGIKQAFTLGRLNGYFDLATFITEYQNMIEFTFGQHYPDTLIHPTLLDFFQYTGFKAFNVSNARITGFEISFTGMGKTQAFDYQCTGGYTYTNPIDKDFDQRSPEENTATTNQNILKYRFYHSIKLIGDISRKNLFAGFTVDWHSHMINIDKAFEDSLRFPNGIPYGIIVPGLKEYREKHNKGSLVIHFRMGMELDKNSKISLIINNILNSEYMTRPADVAPPRVFAIQYSRKF